MKPIEMMDFERFRYFYPFESRDERLTYASLFECEDGWGNLIWTLHIDLERLHKKTRRDPQYSGLQIIGVHRAASGGLRIEEVGGSQEMKERIKKAEIASFQTCEACAAIGQPVQLSGKVLGNVEPIVRVLCAEHTRARGFEAVGDGVAKAS